MKGLIITNTSGGAFFRLYISKWSMNMTFSDGGVYENIQTVFIMYTNYEPTATNLATFKAMIGGNTGDLYNTLQVIPHNLFGSYQLTAMSINNSNISGTVRVTDGFSEVNFDESQCSSFSISKIAVRRIL